MAEQQRYYQGTGRRKEAVARVRLFPGNGEFQINGQTPEDYFGVQPMIHHSIQRPLELTDTLSSYNVQVKVRGGGHRGQAGAVSLGIARALLDANSDFRPALKKAGLLTRDARAKERKKVGLKRARKRPQYTKR
jgi:small subunit ribosomal protein S9